MSACMKCSCRVVSSQAAPASVPELCQELQCSPEPLALCLGVISGRGVLVDVFLAGCRQRMTLSWMQQTLWTVQVERANVCLQDTDLHEQNQWSCRRGPLQRGSAGMSSEMSLSGTPWTRLLPWMLLQCWLCAGRCGHTSSSEFPCE